MKALHRFERCFVALERGLPRVVRWRERRWTVLKLLDTWAYRSRWWTTPELEGEARTYFLLATAHGELEVFSCEHPDAKLAGWFVSAMWD